MLELFWNMDTKIIVATHKEYLLLEDERYLPVFVGAANSNLDLPYQRDDEGENISIKNQYYSELTGLYWAYKNLKADYIGLCHYHRYFDLNNILKGKNITRRSNCKSRKGISNV